MEEKEQGFAFLREVVANAVVANTAVEPALPVLDSGVKQRATIDFYGDRLDAVMLNDASVWTPVGHVCDLLGLSAQRQTRKLRSSGWARVAIMATPSARGEQQAIALNAEDIPMWLGGINIKKVADPATREKLLRFQREARDALRDHFLWGSATKSPAAPAPVQMSQALKLMAELAERHEALETQVLGMQIARVRVDALHADLERRIVKLEGRPFALRSTTASDEPTRLDTIRKSFEVDVRANIRAKWVPEGDLGATNRDVNKYFKVHIGRERRRWNERDFIVAVELAENELHFKMTVTRTLILDFRPKAA